LEGAVLFIVGEMILAYATEKVGDACYEAAKAGWKSLTGGDLNKSKQENIKKLTEMQNKFDQLHQEQQQQFNAQLEEIKKLLPSPDNGADEDDNLLQLRLASKKIKALNLPALTQHITANMRDMNSQSSVVFNGVFKGQVNNSVQAVTNGDFNFGT